MKHSYSNMLPHHEAQRSMTKHRQSDVHDIKRDMRISQPASGRTLGFEGCIGCSAAP